jgi:hypothetical protein
MPVFEKPPVLPEPDWTLLIAKQPSGDEMGDVEHWKTRCLDLEEALRRTKHQLTAHEQINAGQNAQIIIQDLTLRKLNETLNIGDKKDTDRVKLYPKGNGRHMTEQQFINELKEDRAKRADKVEVRKQRKAAREMRCGEGVELVTQWNEIKENHAAAVRDWQVECERLNVEGVRKKDWPKKPKWPLKPKWTPQQAVEADCDEEDDSGLVVDGVDEQEGGSSSTSESSDEDNALVTL